MHTTSTSFSYKQLVHLFPLKNTPTCSSRDARSHPSDREVRSSRGPMLGRGKETCTSTSAHSFTVAQASVYGKCIAADFNNVYKDKCLTEFLRLKDCYLVRLHVRKARLDLTLPAESSQAKVLRCKSLVERKATF